MIVFAQFTETESEAIDRIVERAVELLPEIDRLTFRMDIAAVHAHTPLDLKTWSEADIGNLGHDVAGIIRHMDRDTGELTDCFVPRFALPDDLVARIKARISAAKRDLGEGLGGFHLVDLIADNFPLELKEIRALIVEHNLDTYSAETDLLDTLKVALEFVASFTGNGAPCEHWPKWWDHDALQGDNRNEERLRQEIEDVIARY